METAVAEYAKVLGGGDGEAVFVERAEFDGVAIERGLEEWHGGLRVEREGFGSEFGGWLFGFRPGDVMVFFVFIFVFGFDFFWVSSGYGPAV